MHRSRQCNMHSLGLPFPNSRTCFLFSRCEIGTFRLATHNDVISADVYITDCLRIRTVATSPIDPEISIGSHPNVGFKLSFRCSGGGLPRFDDAPSLIVKQAAIPSRHFVHLAELRWEMK